MLQQSRQISESVDHIVNRLETQLKTKLQKLVGECHMLYNGEQSVMVWLPFTESRNILSRKADDINGLLQELDRKVLQ